MTVAGISVPRSDQPGVAGGGEKPRPWNPPSHSGPRARMGRGVSMSAREPGETESPSGTLPARTAAHPATQPAGRALPTDRLPQPAEGAATPAVTAVSPASAAPPLPQLRRRSRPRGGVAEPPPTGVVDVQLVRDALVAPAEDDHQLPDGYGSVSVPGAGHRPGEGGNPPPVEEAGSRHLPNPRPSAHNAPRATGPTARGGDRAPPPAVRAGGPARDPRAPPTPTGPAHPSPRRRGWPSGRRRDGEPLPCTGPACPSSAVAFPQGLRGSTLSIFRVGVPRSLDGCHGGPRCWGSGRAWGKAVTSPTARANGPGPDF